MSTPSDQKTVSLVLGSGGARGLAHIGIIRRLEECGCDIRSISGCSMGALVGGIYAAGKLDDFTNWVRAIDKIDIVRLLSLSWRRSGLLDIEKVIETLSGLVGDQRIEELPIRFTAVAAELATEKEIWISDGPIFDAIRASISLPLFFTPVLRKGRILLDGGILNPVPIAPTFQDDTDLTIAVNLGGLPVDPDKIATARNTADNPAGDRDDNDNDETHQSLLAAAAAHISAFIDELASNNSPPTGELEMLEIATQTFDAMQGAIARHKLAAYPPDHTIEIPRNIARAFEFDRADELIRFGYDAAREQFRGCADGTP